MQTTVRSVYLAVSSVSDPGESGADTGVDEIAETVATVLRLRAQAPNFSSQWSERLHLPFKTTTSPEATLQPVLIAAMVLCDCPISVNAM